MEKPRGIDSAAMDEDAEMWAMQVWSDKKEREFWDICFWARKPGDAKGVATFLDATPRLSWMSNKTLAEVWFYLLEQKKLKRLDFSFTQENKTLMADLLIRPAHRPDQFPQPSAPRRTSRGPSRRG
jgi:hypothetical protein